MDSESIYNYPNVEAFISLQVIGGALYTLMTISGAIAQRRGGSRHATFFSFCLAWIVFCLSYTLLYFAGQQAARPAPDFVLCNLQSALVYSAPPLAGSATVSLVTHLFLNILLALSSGADKRRSNYTSILLVVLPWVIWVAIFVGILLFGFHHPDNVVLSPNGTFCIIVGTSIPKLTAVWAMLAGVVLVAEETSIALLLYRNREIFSGFGQSMTMAIRVGIFTLLGIVDIVCALGFIITSKRGVQFDILIAIIPSGGSIIFGTQKDLLLVWVPWKKFESNNEQRETTNSAVLSTIVWTRDIDSIQLAP